MHPHFQDSILSAVLVFSNIVLLLADLKRGCLFCFSVLPKSIRIFNEKSPADISRFVGTAWGHRPGFYWNVLLESSMFASETETRQPLTIFFIASRARLMVASGAFRTFTHFFSSLFSLDKAASFSFRKLCIRISSPQRFWCIFRGDPSNIHGKRSRWPLARRA